jgi:hypothetical protein
VRSRIAALCAAALFTLTLAACTGAGPPPPGTGTDCRSFNPPVGQIIANHFADTPDLNRFEYFGYRESRCGQSGYVCNSSQHCGLFQLSLQYDQPELSAVCPFSFNPPAWADPNCNAAAARLVYNQSGTAPWGG